MDSSVSTKDETCFLRVCHHISNAVYSSYVLVTCDISVCRRSWKARACTLLQSSWDSAEGCRVANFMKLSSRKTEFILLMKIGAVICKYTPCESFIMRTDCTKDLGMFINGNLYFHLFQQVFSQSAKLLDP